MKPKNLLASVLATLALTTLPAAAEVSVRECIGGPATAPPPGQSWAYEIPPSASVNLLTMQFNLYDASDAVFDGQVFVPEDAGAPGKQRVRFNFLVDGSTSGRLTTPIQYYYRTPHTGRSTMSFRAFYQGLGPGDHTATLQLVNNSTSVLTVSGAYIDSLFLNASEAAAGSYNPNSQTVGTSYTTIGQMNVPTVSNRHLFVSSYIRASAAGTLTFRYLVNGVQKEFKIADFAGLDNGAMVEWLIQNAATGQPITLQAKSSTGSATVTVVEMSAQALPQYSVLETVQDNVVSTSGPRWSPVPIASTPAVSLNSLSLSGPQGPAGDNATCMWGGGDTQLSQSAPSELELLLRMYQNADAFPFDLAHIAYSPTTVPTGYHQQSDLGCGAGLFGPPTTYRVEQQVHDVCGNRGFTYGHRRLQFLVLPAPCIAGVNCNQNWPGTNCALDNHTCTSSVPRPPQCQSPCAYQCTMNSSLVLKGVPAPNWCG